MIKMNLNSKQTKLLLIAIASVLVIPIGLAMAADLSCGPPENECTGTNENDVITGTDAKQDKGNKILKGQGGDDILIGLGQDDRLEGGTGDDELVGDENIFGSPRGVTDGSADGDDELDGAGGNDYMTGSGGNDVLTGGVGAGRDQLFGGPGVDQMTGGNGGDDMDGGPGNDLMFGGNGPDYMVGGPGDDRLEGGNGADLLFGGEGDDILISTGDSYVDGGPGNDICHVVLDTDIVVSCETIIEVILSDPALTLNGADPLNIVFNVDFPYVDLGATCNDPQEGVIPEEITDDDLVLNILGTSYVVLYDCIDSNGNVAPQISRTVNVVAGQTPVITITGDPFPSLVQGVDVYSEDGAICSDPEDGDSDAAVGGDTVVDVINTYNVTYDCTDASGNAATTVTRVVSVVAVPGIPFITLNGVTPLNLVVNVDAYVEAAAICHDVEDGDSTVTDINGVVDTSTIATYLVTYDCTDTALNDAPQVSRIVNVVAGQSPTLTLNGASVVNIVTGSAIPIYNEEGATCNDPEEGDITANVVIVETPSIVDVVATYNVTYDCQDASGNDASQISRTVNVIPVPTVDLQPMIDQIQGLVDAVPTSLMTQKNANQILNPLNSAQGNFDDGNNTGACNNMSQFDNKLNKAIDQDKIPIGEGVDLLNQSAVIQAANCV